MYHPCSYCALVRRLVQFLTSAKFYFERNLPLWQSYFMRSWSYKCLILIDALANINAICELSALHFYVCKGQKDAIMWLHGCLAFSPFGNTLTLPIYRKNLPLLGWLLPLTIIAFFETPFFRIESLWIFLEN